MLSPFMVIINKLWPLMVQKGHRYHYVSAHCLQCSSATKICHSFISYSPKLIAL